MNVPSSAAAATRAPRASERLQAVAPSALPRRPDRAGGGVRGRRLAEAHRPGGHGAQRRAFRLLPEAVATAFGYALPAVELALAGLLLVGLATRVAAAGAAVLLVMFMLGIAAAWARGLSIDCGCFGATGATVTDPVRGYVLDLLRDAGLLLLLALWLVAQQEPAVARRPPRPYPLIFLVLFLRSLT